MSITGKLKRARVTERIVHDYPKAESTFVDVDGTSLHFVIVGTGRPVVLIHGNPGSCEDWVKLYAPLAAHFCVFAFDRPGHGHSDRPDHNSKVDVEVQARLLNAALERLHVERPILVGHSWGGALALIYALTYPDSVSGLVLLAPAAYESHDGVSFLSKIPAWPFVGDLLNTLFTPLLAAWLVRTDLQKAFAPDQVPKGYLQHTLSEWTTPRKVKWYSVDDSLLNASLAHFSPDYGKLKLPVTIMTGDSDLIVPAPENAIRLAAALPHANLRILEKTGHQIPFVRPDEVAQAVETIAEITTES